MKKGLKKITKILVLIAMIFSDLITPISVLANEITNRDPIKGDVGINKEVTNNGDSATVSVGSTNEKGGVKVTKTVSKTDTEGRYKIDFKIEGKDDETSTEVPKPVYAVVVFDRSGSMKSTEKETDECIKWERDWLGRSYCAKFKTISDNKWENAVSGAITFAKTLSNKINGAKIALVGFSGDNGYYNYDYKYDDAEIIKVNNNTWFSGTELTSDDFGSPIGGTNLQAGLMKAKELLDTIPDEPDEKAYKYVVVISDGQPTFYYDDNGYTAGNGQTTNKKTYDKTISAATDVKNLGAEIFSIGYMLPEETDGNYKDAKTILTEVASLDKVGSGVTHYVDADPEKVANAFTNIAEEMSTASAGTNAVLTDNIGGKFTLTTDSTARSYVSETIANITEEGTTLSFYVDIDKDAPTDWYNTNEGFELKYTNAKGEEKTLTCDQNPQVYWVQNTYDYIVNYYKDSFNNNNKIKSETRKALNGTVINESNVERDKYLPKGYEFNTIDPANITITNNGEVKEINILYTIKKFNYIINYYYDEVLNNSITETNIPYGTRVNSQDYYLKENEIREGYILDTVKSDNSSYTINDNTVVINIYYKKNSYEYSVNYFFNNEKGFTNNSEAIYGDKITARSKWLTNEELNAKGKNDYFLDPNKTDENNSEITIGTDSSKNVLDIYYINTNFDNITETISKTTNTNKVISSNDKVSYTVNYNTQINNVRNGDTIAVTITDTLPGAIIESESTLNGGVYNSENNTITWTKTYSITEYQSVYTVSERINYTVKYQDSLSKNGSNLINTVYGNTTVSHENVEDKITSGKEDTATVPVEIKGTVTVYFKDEQGNDIAVKQELGEKLAGTSYTTNAKEITGYTLKEEPTNKNGNYIEGNIDVIYYYTKNDGNITENELVKEGTEFVSNINDTFNYKLKYAGKVEEYVGKATLTITDILPLKGTIVSKDNRCTFENNTIICTAEYTVNGTLEINEEFNFQVKYSDIKEDKIINSATAKLALENKEEETTDETETEVYKGTVVATYKTDKGVKLHDDVETIDFAGTNYTTETKSFYGYTLTKVPTNKEGTYVANETIQVDYVYIKNEGTVTENKVNKIQNNTITDINSEYNYVLSYTGKVEDYVGEVTLELTDTLPYNAEIILKDNKCVVNGRTIVCKDVYTVDKEHQVINATFNIVLKYINVGSEVKNIVNSKLIYGNKNVTDKDEVIDVVPSGTVVATYKTDKGVTLSNNVTTTDLVGKEYTTETKSFYGYTLTKVPTNKEGTYIANETIQVDYVYAKNIGTSEEELNKDGIELVGSITDAFDYTITYNTEIKDYVGKATLTITDILPFEIDAEKSEISNNCKYNKENNTIVCKYEMDNTPIIINIGNINIDNNGQIENINKNIIFNIEENFKLYYINVDKKEVTNKVTAELTYGNIAKTTDDEHTTEVEEGTVIVNYVTKDGEKLTDSITLTGPVGTTYETVKKEFDKYSFIEVKGEVEGTYTKEQKEITYVYDLTILPPQTGVEANMFMYVNYIFALIALAVAFRTYKTIKNN